MRVVIHAIFARPKRLHRRADPDGLLWHASKPDLDNVIKAVLDGLQGRAFDDDRQVVVIEAQAHYAEKTGKPRTEIEVYELAATNQPTDTHLEPPHHEPSEHLAPGPTRAGDSSCD